MTASKDQFALDQALLNAAGQGRASDLAPLLASGANPSAKRPHDLKTAFLKAAESGRVDCLEILLPLSDTKTRDSSGRTALMLAAAGANLDAVRFLLPLCDADAVCHKGRTALQHATHTDSFDREVVVRVLAPATQAIDQIGKNGKTALHQAVEARLDGVIDVFTRLANPNIQDKKGQTPLMTALEFGVDDDPWIAALAPITNLGLKSRAGQYAFDFAIDDNQWDWADTFAEGTPEGRVQKEFKRAGPEKMPRWAALMEARSLAQEVAAVSAAQKANPLPLEASFPTPNRKARAL